MLQPVNSCQRVATDWWIAMPPPTESFKAEKFTCFNSSLFNKALNKVFTPVIATNGYFFSSFTKPGISRGFVINTAVTPNSINNKQFTVRAKTWYRGKAKMANRSRLRSPTKGWAIHLAWNTFTIILPCDNIAPFATPVVPPVYCKKAKSLRSICGRTYWRYFPTLNTSRNVTAFGNLYFGTSFFTYFTTKFTNVRLPKDNWSPIRVKMTCFTEVLKTIFSNVEAKLDTTTMALAPLSCSWCSNSRGV